MGKSLDLIGICTAQFALDSFARGSSRGDQDSLRSALMDASKGATRTLSTDRHVRFGRFLKLEDENAEAVLPEVDGVQGLAPGGHVMAVQWLVPPTDLACTPRRDGGSATYRIAVRALERYAMLF